MLGTFLTKRDTFLKFQVIFQTVINSKMNSMHVMKNAKFVQNIKNLQNITVEDSHFKL